MTGMNRREYKRKADTVAIDEASQVETNIGQWKAILPTQIEKLTQQRVEVRVAALKSINYLITGSWLGEELYQFLNDITLAVHNSIFNYASQEEHDLALTVLCNLSLSSFIEFQPYAITFLNDLMPELPNTTEEQCFRFFAAAFIVSFSIQSQDTCIRTMQKFIDFINNKHNRAIKFAPCVVASIVSGLALMISILPESAAASTLYEPLQTALNKVLLSKKTEVVLASLDFAAAMFSAISEFEADNPAPESEESKQTIANKFAFSLIDKIKSLSENVPTKAEAQEVKAKGKMALSVLNNGPISEEIVLNSQTIQIDGFRKSYMLQGIRKITKEHFQQVMMTNKGIHDTLGFDLMTQQKATIMRKKMIGKILQDRVDNTRDRELEISKKRRQKENNDTEN